MSPRKRGRVTGKFPSEGYRNRSTPLGLYHFKQVMNDLIEMTNERDRMRERVMKARKHKQHYKELLDLTQGDLEYEYEHLKQVVQELFVMTDERDRLKKTLSLMKTVENDNQLKIYDLENDNKILKQRNITLRRALGSYKKYGFLKEAP